MTPSWLSSNPDMQRAERSHVILAGEFNLEISFKAWENEEINSTVRWLLIRNIFQVCIPFERSSRVPDLLLLCRGAGLRRGTDADPGLCDSGQATLILRKYGFSLGKWGWLNARYFSKSFLLGSTIFCSDSVTVEESPMTKGDQGSTVNPFASNKSGSDTSDIATYCSYVLCRMFMAS